MHPMESHLLIFMIFLILFVGVSASTVTPDVEMYWKSVLPNTPMPSVIKSSLPSVARLDPRPWSKLCPLEAQNQQGGRRYWRRGYTRKEVEDRMKRYGQIYMLETQMAPGKRVEVQLASPGPHTISTFLPRKVADSIPFSSDKLPEILDRFSVDPKSKEASAVKNTINECHVPVTPEENKYCATSLEGMVQFAKSVLGDRLNPLSPTTADSTHTNRGSKTEYRITRVDRVADYGSPVVVCHKVAYPYAVFYCHQLKMTAAYTVSLASNKGALNDKASAVCHKDTSWWNPKNISLQMLKIKPGNATAVCHFLDDLSVAWTSK